MDTFIRSETATVRQVLAEIDENLGKYVAVRGVLYFGNASPAAVDDEFILFEDAGKMDGTAEAQRELRPEGAAFLVLNQPGIENCLGGGLCGGEHLFKVHAIVIGRLRLRPQNHLAELVDIACVVSQIWEDNELFAGHSLWLGIFGSSRVFDANAAIGYAGSHSDIRTGPRKQSD